MCSCNTVFNCAVSECVHHQGEQSEVTSVLAYANGRIQCLHGKSFSERRLMVNDISPCKYVVTHIKAFSSLFFLSLACQEKSLKTNKKRFSELTQGSIYVLSLYPFLQFHMNSLCHQVSAIQCVQTIEMAKVAFLHAMGIERLGVSCRQSLLSSTQGLLRFAPNKAQTYPINLVDNKSINF